MAITRTTDRMSGGWIVSVLDHSAKGYGVNDDTVVIQAAIAEAKARLPVGAHRLPI